MPIKMSSLRSNNPIRTKPPTNKQVEKKRKVPNLFKICVMSEELVNFWSKAEGGINNKNHFFQGKRRKKLEKFINLNLIADVRVFSFFYLFYL